MLCRTAILFYSITIIVDASHFLGGTITWSPLNPADSNTSVRVVITQTYAWTWELAKCTASNILNGEAVPISTNYRGMNETLSCIRNCETDAISYSAPPIWPYCTDVSSVQGSTVGRRSDTVTVRKNSDFIVAFASEAWRPLATATAANWSISSRINLNPRIDNGLYNSAPVTTMMSPINIPIGIPQRIQVPIGDADGDTIRCRWSNGTSECGGVCPPNSLPNNTIIYPNCTIVITGQKAQDWFAVALMVEDFIDASSLAPLSTVPVQFLVQVISLPTCQNAPRIIGVPVDDSCTPIIVGQTFRSRLIAINDCGPNVNISDIATLSFSGMFLTNIIKDNSTHYYKSIVWTPTVTQKGFQVMCVMAVNSQLLQSPPYCFTFYVSQNGSSGCPGDIYLTTNTSTSTTSIVLTTNRTTSQISTTRTLTQTATITTSTTSSTSTKVCVLACNGMQLQVSRILLGWLIMKIAFQFFSPIYSNLL